VGVGKRRIQFNRSGRVLPSFRKGFSRSEIAEIARCRVAIRKAGIGRRACWINVDGALEALDRPLQAMLRPLIPFVSALKIGAVCVRVLCHRLMWLLRL
jgi:hypothetical protein